MAYLFNSLSLFLPCYNEEANLESTVSKTLPILIKIAKNWELIIVNDGSGDKTGAVAFKIQKLTPKTSKLSLIHSTAAMAPPSKVVFMLLSATGLP